MSKYRKLNVSYIKTISQYIEDCIIIKNNFKLFKELYRKNPDLQKELMNLLNVLISYFEIKQRKFCEFCINNGLIE